VEDATSTSFLVVQTDPNDDQIIGLQCYEVLSDLI